ncbi:unnamed protein product [Brassicogethes aeneus]|uniref:Peptide deformylase n=1 Tax=Brassicogethes aeneus TaxID=1431903 RepID=A0A9P0AYD6_BRAAE|nr:unnamed protein product [Brassicogethes aeneus]
MKSKVNIICKRYISLKHVGTWYSSLVKPRKHYPPYNHIVQIGDPCLRVKTEKLPMEAIHSNEIKYITKVLKKVAKNHNCVGLSAPQIGIPIQMFIMEFNEKNACSFSKKEFKTKEMAFLPQTVVINPEIKVTDYTKIVFPEACGSVKGMYAEVPRHYSIQLKALDEDGKQFELNAKGWLARVIQHEMDHLNGTLYTDIMNRKTLTCGCWNVVNERGGKVELPYGEV